MTTNGKFRDPRGHFIDRGAMLTAWLPKMCSWARPWALQAALETLARFCEHEAGSEYSCLGKHLTGDGFEVGQLNTSVFLRDAEKWLKRRDVLLRAVDEVRHI